MLTSEYAKDFTQDKRTSLSRVWGEVKELAEEVLFWNWPGIKEEFGDVVHHVQLFMYTRGWDTKLWMWCAQKFIDRQKVWQEFYRQTGVPGRACYGGNYNRLAKVIAHLGKFGVSESAAVIAYGNIVHNAGI